MQRIIYSKTDEKIKMSVDEINQLKQTEIYEKIYKKNFEKEKRSIKNRTYFKKHFLKDILVITLASLLTTISIDYFISSTGDAGLFPGGLSSFARFFAITTANLIKGDQSSNILNSSSLFFVYLFLINFPLFIFGFMKVGLKFTLTSILYIFLSLAWNQILNIIPVVNPREFNVISNYKLISSIPGEWTSTIWMFVFSIFGGAFLGASYSLTYTVGSSTAGTDFISYYVSKKYNRQIGAINMKINFIILALVIVLNTINLSVDLIDPDMKLSTIRMLNDEKFNKLYDAAVESKKFSKVVGSVLYLPLNWTTSNTDWTKEEIARIIASNAKFTNYGSSLIWTIKFKFIFGPSLFASAVVMIIQGIVIDKIYPKNKIITILINTSKPEQVKDCLFELGYRNDINIIENKTVRKNSALVKQSVVMISISLVDWKTLEEEVIKTDTNMNISFIKTMKVKGQFNYSLDNEKFEMILCKKVIENKKIVKKIEHDSIVMTKNRIIKDSKTRNIKKFHA
ncbi:YitT family protein [Mycoplasma cottewii]|uniref:YitT family protein n=1 Tax=Mycoplasma cottewii TaxID=51364 RepID=A0ABY5TXF9_9MOLU|nr:YitT family ABC transporter [Mycoplasma cottewii]UWD35358.1 YitT family protein [Mycoplasma cottewii]